MKFSITMTYSRFVKLVYLFIISVLALSCVEPFDVETQGFESILIVNTTITDQEVHQEIYLSRTFKFEEDGSTKEQGATVRVLEDAGTEYVFEEINPGIYKSVQKFAAKQGKEYQLTITTADGRSYSSDKVVLPAKSSIDRVYPKRMIGDTGADGIGLLIDSFDLSGESVYYRFEYEETYRINPPFWVPKDIEGSYDAEGMLSLELVERPVGKRVCYNTNISNNIQQVNTSTLDEDRISALVLNFIPLDDIRIEDRYSILVRQYVQSREAFGFYELLKRFSESESLFSQVQPGFITGNIVSDTDDSEKVLGFFDVSSIAETRIFFNRADVVEETSRYYERCITVIPEPRPLQTIQSFKEDLLSLLDTGTVVYLAGEGPDAPFGDPFTFITRECGDCTANGKSAVPDFWEDE